MEIWMIVVGVVAYIICGFVLATMAARDDAECDRALRERSRPADIAWSFIVTTVAGPAIFAYEQLDEWTFGKLRQKRDLARRNAIRAKAGHPPLKA